MPVPGKVLLTWTPLPRCSQSGTDICMHVLAVACSNFLLSCQQGSFNPNLPSDPCPLDPFLVNMHLRFGMAADRHAFSKLENAVELDRATQSPAQPSATQPLGQPPATQTPCTASCKPPPCTAPCNSITLCNPGHRVYHSFCQQRPPTAPSVGKLFVQPTESLQLNQSKAQ